MTESLSILILGARTRTIGQSRDTNAKTSRVLPNFAANNHQTTPCEWDHMMNEYTR